MFQHIPCEILHGLANPFKLVLTKSWQQKDEDQPLGNHDDSMMDR